MSETAPEVTEVEPAAERAEAAWEKTAARDGTPASVAQPMTDEELVASLDRAIDHHEYLDRERDGIEVEPEPEPEAPDYSKVVETAIKLGVSLTTATPDKLGGIDLQDEGAIRQRLTHIKENDENAVALEQAIASQADSEYAQAAVSEIALDHARAILDEAEPTQAWAAANILQEQHPQVFEQFLSEWTAADPESASVWASQHPPIDWQARAEEREYLLADEQAEAEQQAREQEKAAITASFEKRIAELEADPKTAPYVEGALNMLAMQAEDGTAPAIQNPQQAKILLDATVKTAREVSRTYEEADEVAKLLAPMEERIQLNAALEVEELTGVFPDLAEREELLERTRLERISEWGFRGPQPSLEESNEAFVESIFEAVRTNHPSVWEAGEPTTPEEEAARDKEREDRRKARLKALYPRSQ